MKTFYLVQRDGVYLQGVVALRETLEEAEEAALAALKAEHDSYHSMVINTIELGGEGQSNDIVTYRRVATDYKNDCCGIRSYRIEREEGR